MILARHFAAVCWTTAKCLLHQFSFETTQFCQPRNLHDASSRQESTAQLQLGKLQVNVKTQRQYNMQKCKFVDNTPSSDYSEFSTNSCNPTAAFRLLNQSCDWQAILEDFSIWCNSYFIELEIDETVQRDAVLVQSMRWKRLKPQMVVVDGCSTSIIYSTRKPSWCKDYARHCRHSKMAVSSHLGYYRAGNCAIQSAEPENPCLERTMEWIGCTVCEIFAFELNCDLEIWVRGHSRSLKVAPLDQPTPKTPH